MDKLYNECVLKTNRKTGEIFVEIRETDGFWGTGKDDVFCGNEKDEDDYDVIGLTMRKNETKEHATKRLIKIQLKYINDKMKTLKKRKEELNRILESCNA